MYMDVDDDTCIGEYSDWQRAAVRGSHVSDKIISFMSINQAHESEHLHFEDFNPKLLKAVSVDTRIL